tara:strand:+ start:44 stop:1339 length:1296 start_codon:yes stop_codon:yes gene_type:complete
MKSAEFETTWRPVETEEDKEEIKAVVNQTGKYDPNRFNTEERLLGSRVTEILGKAINTLPKDNPVLNTIGSGLGYIAENYTHKDLIKAEEAIIDKVGEIAPEIGFDPTFLQLSAGFLIPGGGEMKTVKRTIKSARRAHLMSNTVEDLVSLEKANAARAKKLAKGDIKRSAEVTVGLDPNEVKVYGANRAIKEAHVPRELGGATGPTRIAGIPHKNIHHELMKDYYAEYVVNARKLVEQGLATEQDVINLARIAKKYGFGMGDYKSASAFVDKIPHDYGHEIMKRKGVQPTPSTRLESPYSGPDLITEKSRISKISNIKDLTDDFEQAIKDIGIPMRDEINSLQDAWDRVLPNDRMKLFELRWARDAIKKKLTEEYPTAIKVKTDKRFIKAQKQYKDFKNKLEKEMLELQENAREVARQKKELAIENLNPDQ